MNIKRIMFIHPGIRWPKITFANSLGILYLISSLRKDFGNKFVIEVLEQKLYNLTFEQVASRIAEFKPDLVGFSCTSSEKREMEVISKMVKGIFPECVTVLGGPHAEFFYDDALENSNIDFVVKGEGEKTFSELLNSLLYGNPSVESINGLVFKKNGKIVLNPPRAPIDDLDSIPFPAWEVVDFKRYSKQISMNGEIQPIVWANIFTSRGCPYHCAYCHNIFGKKTRFRSPENVIAEIELLTKKYGVEEIQIIDDIFNLDLVRAKKICDLIIERGIKIRISFPNALRGDIMDKELIQKLKKAGCYWTCYAVESASPRIQKLINKNLDLEKLKKVIEWTHEEGIITRGYFMLGFPSETLEEIESTVKYALESKLSNASFFSVQIYPHSDLMEIAKKIYPDFDFSRFDNFDFHYWDRNPFYSRATGIDLFLIQRRAYRRFFLRFNIIFRALFIYSDDLFVNFVKNELSMLSRQFKEDIFKLFYAKK